MIGEWYRFWVVIFFGVFFVVCRLFILFDDIDSLVVGFVRFIFFFIFLLILIEMLDLLSYWGEILFILVEICLL